MRYDIEKVLISDKGEIFRVGDFLTVKHKKDLLYIKTYGKFCGIDSTSVIDYIEIDVSTDYNSKIKYINPSQIKNITR